LEGGSCKNASGFRGKDGARSFHMWDRTGKVMLEMRPRGASVRWENSVATDLLIKIF